jgi:hypothetical protein
MLASAPPIERRLVRVILTLFQVTAHNVHFLVK